MQLNMAYLLKFGDGNGPNLCRVKKVDIRSTFIEKIFRSGLTVVSLNDIMIWPTCCNSNHCIVFKTWKINLNIYFMKLIWIVFNSCTLHVFVYLLQQCHKVIIVLYIGSGCRDTMSPVIPWNDLLSLLSCRVTSKPIKIISVPHATFPNSVSTSRIMIFKKKYLAFTFIKILFFKSQHDIKVLIILKQLVLKSLLLSRLRKTVYLQRKNNFNWE